MSEVVHNLPPDNGADRSPRKWENADKKDRRGIRKVWGTGKRADDREVTEAPQNDTAEFAKTATGDAERLEDRKIDYATDADKEVKDPRNFPYYNQKEEA